MKSVKAFGGYVGNYNGFLLKSSYEYIYAKILEFDNIKFKVEAETYLLDEGRTYYTPDFFLYDNHGELYQVVEIRGYRFNIEERVDSTTKLREILPKSIDVKLFTELDLKRKCKERGLSYNQLKTSWRTNPDNVRGSSKGEANAMYGKPQKESTKKLIKELADQRVKDNPDKYRKMGMDMVNWCRENNYDFLRHERVPRHTLICEMCGANFIVIDGDKDKRRFCSHACGSKNASNIASNINIAIRKDRDVELRAFILKWANQNRDIVLNTPFNKITPTLSELLLLIKEEFNVIDFRTISRALGTKHRKDFLEILQKHVSTHK